MITDAICRSHLITYPFQITRFCSLYDHNWCQPHFFAGESHNFWEFTYVLDGEVEIVQGDKIYLLKTGDFIGSPPMVFHSCTTQVPCRQLNFSFEHTGKLPEQFAEGVFSLAPAEADELKSIFFRLLQAFGSGVPDGERISEAACAMNSLLLRLSHHAPSQQRTHSRSAVLYQKLVQTMHEAIRDNLSVQQIAARNAVSMTTMKDLFRKYAGISPKRYYADLRGIEALRLLEEGMEITQIVETMNYSSPNYFSYSFKQQFGAPPGRYRRTH